LLPTLVIVGGPPGAGKTTLAHRLAFVIGCPVVSRDQIKEGMAHVTPGFTPGPGDELTRRTFPVFFGVLELLLRAGVTTVAEAAFQDPAWRTGLEPLRGRAQFRVVHCTVAADLAYARKRRRREENPGSRAHPDPDPDAAAHALRHSAFTRLSLDAPWIEVDTSSGYEPGLGEIVSFVNRVG
jgi:predicted kinase